MAVRNIIIYALAILILLAPRNAAAARRALLYFDNFTHWVDFNYLYSGTEVSEGGRENSSRLNRFQESYGFLVDYAIYNPRIINGVLQPGIRLEQRDSDSDNGTSSRVAGSYNLSGNILDRSRFPGNFYSTYDTSYIHEPFLPSYSLTTFANGYSLTYKNAYLPTQFSYNQNTTETSGMIRDTKQDISSLSLSVSNNFRNRSQTSAGVTWFYGSSETEGFEKTSRSSVTMKGANILKLSTSPYNRTLTSWLQIDQTEYQDERELLMWNETLMWDFGRALHSQLRYQYTGWETEAGTETTHHGDGTISHTLFDSLTTEVSGAVQDMTLVGGTERSWSAGGFIRYQKKLPARSMFDLIYQHRYELTDRSQTSTLRLRPDEPHTVSFGKPIYLANPNVEVESVVVTSADPVPRLTPYILGVDYDLRPIGLLLEVVILPGSRIGTEENLLISYNFRVSPKLVFDQDLQSAGGNLWLLGNEYRIYTRVDFIDQDLLEGNDDQFVLNSGYIVTAGAEDILQPLTFLLQYEGYRLDLDDHDSVLGRIQYTKYLHRGSLMGNVYDRYSQIRPNESTRGSAASSYWVNTTGVGASYVRTLFSTAYMTLSGNYFTTHGNEISRDDLSLRLDFRWNYGKLLFQFYTQSNWRFEEERDVRDDTVHLVIRRYL